MQASVYHIAVTLFGLVQYTKVILSIEISANTDQDFEEIPCETEMSEEWSMPLLRNGLGDDSYFIWADKKIPFVIGDGFGKNETDNIKGGLVSESVSIIQTLCQITIHRLEKMAHFWRMESK